MLCKVTSKNQITLPKELIDQFKNREYFDARLEDGKIVLEPMIVRPVTGTRLNEIRERVASANLTEDDVGEIVAEARGASRP